ncbi:MAG: thioredoxin domain-containing protein [Candidatus Pacebacteria bacterium]|nr:thioredoxin domain-containing protein [Candidatus Paceibacterota bacterium]
MNSIKKFFKNQTNLSIIIGSLIIGISIVSYGYFLNKSPKKDDSLSKIINADKMFQGKEFKDNEYILGNNKNKITILVYSDFECPFCKMLQENTIQILQKEYALNLNNYSEAQIGIVYRHFAQSYHDKAPNEINASLCTRELYGQNAYINFINRIYSVSPTNNGLDQSTLPDIAFFAVEEAKQSKSEIKKDFNKDEFMTCVNNKVYNQEFESDTQDAIEAGLDGTPYTLILFRDGDDNIIINKVSGAKDVLYFEKIINKLLNIK